MALFRLTGKCNQKCVFCSYPWEKSDKNESDFKSLCRDIKESKDNLIQISGGETFLLGGDFLLKLALFTAKNNKRIEIQTNGLLIKKVSPGVLKNLVKAVSLSKGYFNINLSSSSPDADEKICGIKSGFEDKIEGVKLLNSLGARIRITYVVCRLNYKQTPEFVKFMSKEFPRIKWLQFSFVKSMGRAKDKKIVPKYLTASKHIIKAVSLCLKNKIKCEIDHIPLCMLGKYYRLNVDIEKMINQGSGLHKVEKTHIKKCLNCEYADICSGPRKDYLNIYGGL